MKRTLFPVIILMACTTLLYQSDACAHGFAGKRFFPATLTTDDPFVADEASLPTVSTIRMPGEGESPETRETGISVDLAKRITPHFGLELGETYKILDPEGGSSETGFDNLETGLKYQFLSRAEHELIVSIGLGIDIGGTGSRRVEAERFNTFTPTLYFGKGFGDLPDGADLLKPLAVTGTIGIGIPSRTSTTNENGEVERNPRTLDMGIALEYSIPYLQSNIKDIGLSAPFNRMIPLVEVALQNPLDRGQAGETTGTVNPGIIWAGRSYQLGAEAIIPINSRTGHDVGGIVQLHLFLDDLFPRTIGKPIFGGSP